MFLGACASGSDVGTDARVAYAGRTAARNAMKPSVGLLQDFASEVDIATNNNPDWSNGTEIGIGVSDEKVKLTTTDTYIDNSTFSKTYELGVDKFERNLGGRALLADLTSDYMVYYKNDSDAPREAFGDGYSVPEYRRDKIQVALGGKMTGLDYADFGYWRAEYYTKASRNGAYSFNNYDVQPIYGGKELSAAPSAAASFSGNAVALITYAEDTDGDGFENIYYDTPAAGTARFEFDGTDGTLAVDFDNWYKLVFNGANSVDISGEDDQGFKDKKFSISARDVPLGKTKDISLKLTPASGVSAQLDYKFYGAGAQEVAGGFSLDDTDSTDDGWKTVGIVGAFGGKSDMVVTDRARDPFKRDDDIDSVLDRAIRANEHKNESDTTDDARGIAHTIFNRPGGRH
jgi:hypothetical protein